MSLRTMTIVWSQSETKDTAELLLLLAIADRAGDDGVAWPSITELAEKTRLSERHVYRLVKLLTEDGRLQLRKAQRGRRRVSVYRLGRLPGLHTVQVDDLPFVLSEPFDDLTPCHVVTRRRPDTRVADDLTPRARMAKEEPSVNRQQRAGAREKGGSQSTYTKQQQDLLWEAFIDAGVTRPETRAERSALNAAVRQLCEIGVADPREVVARAIKYQKRYPGISFTAMGLVKHWGESNGNGHGTRTGGKCPECDLRFTRQQMKDHRYTSHGVGTICVDCGDIAAGGEPCRCGAVLA